MAHVRRARRFTRLSPKGEEYGGSHHGATATRTVAQRQLRPTVDREYRGSTPRGPTRSSCFPRLCASLPVTVRAGRPARVPPHTPFSVGRLRPGMPKELTMQNGDVVAPDNLRLRCSRCGGGHGDARGGKLTRYVDRDSDPGSVVRCAACGKKHSSDSLEAAP